MRTTGLKNIAILKKNTAGSSGSLLRATCAISWASAALSWSTDRDAARPDDRVIDAFFPVVEKMTRSSSSMMNTGGAGPASGASASRTGGATVPSRAARSGREGRSVWETIGASSWTTNDSEATRNATRRTAATGRIPSASRESHRPLSNSAPARNGTEPRCGPASRYAGTVTTGTMMIARKSRWRDQGSRIPKLLTAISATAAAMSEWKNDWTTHMPGKELKNPERAITDASRRPVGSDPPCVPGASSPLDRSPHQDDEENPRDRLDEAEQDGETVEAQADGHQGSHEEAHEPHVGQIELDFRPADVRDLREAEEHRRDQLVADAVDEEQDEADQEHVHVEETEVVVAVEKHSLPQEQAQDEVDEGRADVAPAKAVEPVLRGAVRDGRVDHLLLLFPAPSARRPDGPGGGSSGICRRSCRSAARRIGDPRKGRVRREGDARPAQLLDPGDLVALLVEQRLE